MAEGIAEEEAGEGTKAEGEVSPSGRVGVVSVGVEVVVREGGRSPDWAYRLQGRVARNRRTKDTKLEEKEGIIDVGLKVAIAMKTEGKVDSMREQNTVRIDCPQGCLDLQQGESRQCLTVVQPHTIFRQDIGISMTPTRAVKILLLGEKEVNEVKQGAEMEKWEKPSGIRMASDYSDCELFSLPLLYFSYNTQIRLSLKNLVTVKYILIFMHELL